MQWLSYFKATPAEHLQARENGILACGPDHYGKYHFCESALPYSLHRNWQISGRCSFADTFSLDPQVLDACLSTGSWRKDQVANGTTNVSSAVPKPLHSSTWLSPRHSNASPSLSFGQTALNPHQYRHAKKQLREAIIEHHRCVESLQSRRG